MNEDYTPYGEEWKKELSKLPKSVLIDMLAKAHIERKGWEDIATTNSEQHALAMDRIYWFEERETNLWRAFGEFTRAMRWQLSKDETNKESINEKGV
jgi:hypothetical protein